ncbi:hypothetical protein AN639_12860 [Candidatus Epulonipiscium fishelsonii]|uniref:Uncharacterized protein n=1 Tax=Candidatus Epulonipiscium fishelsonii TaxID=77094 RepID=A0ACC8XDA4_9FIRM|nr:hypothetical protein AN396_00815 [Epulopiscium sp. SCG-B11WGA-EpuloA1]ONI42181.1 hypothetical protein AN639_12860 [Epulopiscium sp. SCG-B05WGA-EpuloA1]
MIIVHAISAFLATTAFSIIFNVNRKHLLVCGIIGSVGWTAYIILSKYFMFSEVSSNFIASLLVSIMSYILSKIRFAPITVFLISGVIPLVPGIGLYKTMYFLLFEEYILALKQALVTFQVSGVIAVSISIVTMIPFALKKA